MAEEDGSFKAGSFSALFLAFYKEKEKCFAIEAKESTRR